ncbi:MAG: cytoplasmic chaperone TorD family protein [Actinobacteria bacterium]|nr:cytoplasmic chaperone TorD family protein [Actinomycetota bacterium]
MAAKDFIDVERQRGDCFRLLAACFYPPEMKVLIEEGVLENLHGLLEEVCPEAAACCEGMARALSQASEEELAVAHAKLFVGPFALRAPPYGSLYLESQNRLMGDTTMEVLKMYQRAGLALSGDFKDAPDHIAAELEFMYFLVAKEVHALRQGDRNDAFKYLEMQHEFHEKYLHPWMEPFVEMIRTGSEHEFYRLLAKSLSTFIMKTPVPRTLPGKIGAEA